MNRIILNETSYFGAGCRSVIAVEAARRGFKKAFFVTDKDLIKFGVAAEIIKVFDENQIPYELYSDVKANPTIANVQNGVAAYKASGADFIVALCLVSATPSRDFTSAKSGLFTTIPIPLAVSMEEPPPKATIKSAPEAL